MIRWEDEADGPDEQLTSLMVALHESVSSDATLTVDMSGLAPQARADLEEIKCCLELLEQMRREQAAEIGMAKSLAESPARLPPHSHPIADHGQHAPLPTR